MPRSATNASGRPDVRASAIVPPTAPSRSAQLADLIPKATSLIEAWEARFGPYDAHPASEPDAQRLAAAWEAFGERMADHYPFFHPRYAGQMLKPPHPVAVAGYLAAMLVNPNNHALDGGPGTSGLEVEVVDQLRVMFGLPSPGLGHLTSSGTIANLEALWVAREVHPGKRIVHSSAAHYTHARMCELLRITGTAVAPDAYGRLDLDAVEAECAKGDVGTVVLTTGSTGLGAIDRVDEALALRERYGVRLHVDGAYGGFFTLLARGDDPLVEPAPVPGDRAVRLGRRRPPQARPSALRLRRDPLRRPVGRSASTATTRPSRTSPRPSCTSARSASSARAPARRPPGCGSRSGRCRSSATRAWARSSPPGAAPRSTGRSD